MNTINHRVHWILTLVFHVLVYVGTATVHAQQPATGAPPSKDSPSNGIILGAPEPFPQSAAPPAAVANTPLPAPFQLTPEQQDRLARLLDYWEKESAKVKTFSCRFELLRYDTVFGPAEFAKSKSEGTIRYAAPDKGVFRIERMGEYSEPSTPGTQPTYAMKNVEAAEHWVCDGDSVFEFDSKQKQLVQRKLPPGLKGKEIVDGPLPFIFGATRAKIESRYWIRECLPKGVENQYWFEAFPKRREEAGNFQRVMVILDAKTFRPSALQIFPPTYDPQKNRSREVFVFTDQQVNHVIDRSRDFMNQFISPKVPHGWKIVVQNFDGEGPATQAAERPRNDVNR